MKCRENFIDLASTVSFALALGIASSFISPLYLSSYQRPLAYRPPRFQMLTIYPIASQQYSSSSFSFSYRRSSISFPSQIPISAVLTSSGEPLSSSARTISSRLAFLCRRRFEKRISCRSKFAICTKIRCVYSSSLPHQQRLAHSLAAYSMRHFSNMV